MLVTGEVGYDVSWPVLSNIEPRRLDTGELGTEEGAKSDGCSEKTDHLVDGAVDIESLTE